VVNKFLLEVSAGARHCDLCVRSNLPVLAKKGLTLKWLIATVVLLLGSATLAGKVIADQIEDSGQEEEATGPGVVRSEDVFKHGHSSAQTLFMQAQEDFRRGKTESAIALLRRSIQMDKHDVDAHCFYADVLEAKMKRETDLDPEIFQTCVKEWLLVLRNEVGEERGMTVHGLGFMGTFYEDDDRTVNARQHLVKLTGTAPKPWETDSKYLKRVAGATVSGRIIKDRKATRADNLESGAHPE
jgi:hypothetical protein